MSRNDLIKISIALIVGFVISQMCSRSPTKVSNPKNKTDTVYIEKVFKESKPFKTQVVPNLVFFYQVDTVTKYSKFELSPNFDLVLYSNKDSITLSKYFIGSYPTKPRLLEMDISSKQLKLSTQSIDGKVKTEQYELDLKKYNYRYQDGLTRKRKLNFQFYPSIQYSYRPIHKLHDFDILLNFDTGRINIETGLSSYYYPNLFNSPKMDFKLGIQYKF